MRCRRVGGGVWLRRPLSGKVVGSNPMDTKKINHAKCWCFFSLKMYLKYLLFRKVFMFYLIKMIKCTKISSSGSNKFVLNALRIFLLDPINLFIGLGK